MAQAWTGPIPLTQRQLEVLQVLHELIDLQCLQPTYDQIANELELASKSTVCALLYRLRDKGWIAIEPQRCRLRILHPPPMIPDFDLVFVLAADLGDPMMGGPA